MFPFFLKRHIIFLCIDLLSDIPHHRRYFHSIKYILKLFHCYYIVIPYLLLSNRKDILYTHSLPIHISLLSISQLLQFLVRTHSVSLLASSDQSVHLLCFIHFISLFHRHSQSLQIDVLFTNFHMHSFPLQIYVLLTFFQTYSCSVLTHVPSTLFSLLPCVVQTTTKFPIVTRTPVYVILSPISPPPPPRVRLYPPGGLKAKTSPEFWGIY